MFPEVIGGWFTVDFVCRDCNSRFGSSFDRDLRMNGFVHAARRSLGAGSEYLKGQKIDWTSPLGHSGRMGVPRGFDKPVIIPSKQNDGSIISDDRLFKDRMKKQLRDLGWREEEIREHFLEVVRKAPLDLFIPVVKPGEPIVTWYRRYGGSVTIGYPDMRAPIRYALVAKIALELWCAFGFPSAGPFNRRRIVRSILANDPSDLTVYSTPIPDGSVYDLSYEPFHFCAFGVLHGVAVGLVGFFGFLKYAIALGRVKTDHVGDWLSSFWIFPVSFEQNTREIFSENPPPDLMHLDFTMMDAAAWWYRQRSVLSQDSTNEGTMGVDPMK